MSESVCQHCGRYMRSDEARTGTPRRYCSASCRRAAGARLHRELEDAIISLLAARDFQSSICPSEAARARCGDDFRRHMEDTRRAARRLAHREIVRITQRGRTVHPAEIRGPIRIERGAQFAQGQRECVGCTSAAPGEHGRIECHDPAPSVSDRADGTPPAHTERDACPGGHDTEGRR